MDDQNLPPWLDPPALAEHIQIPVTTLYAWRHRGIGPPAHRFGRHLRYSRQDVLAWIQTQAA